MRRPLAALRQLTAGAFIATLSASAGLVQAQQSKPNILVIYRQLGD